MLWIFLALAGSLLVFMALFGVIALWQKKPSYDIDLFGPFGGFLLQLVTTGSCLAGLYLCLHFGAEGESWRAYACGVLTVYDLAGFSFFRTAHWGSLQIYGGRLRTTFREGPRKRLFGIHHLDEFNGELDPTPIQGSADVRDGSEQQYTGTVDIVRSRHIRDRSGRPRYPEVNRQLAEGLPNALKRVIETFLSSCSGNDLLERDSSVQLGMLCAFIFPGSPIHERAADLGLPAPARPGSGIDPTSSIIDWYEEHSIAIRAALREHIEAKRTNPGREDLLTDIEEEYAIHIVAVNITFTGDEATRKAQILVRKATVFRESQQVLEENSRMTPQESARNVRLLGQYAQGIEVMAGDGGAGGADPLGLQRAAAILAAGLKGGKDPSGGGS